MEEYGIKVLNLDDFERGLGEIIWTEELKSKLDQLKGRPDVPEFAF